MTAFEQALAMVEREDWPAAEESLRATLAEQPDFPDALHLLGLSLWHQGKPAAAEPFFLQAHARAPHFPPSCFYLAGIHVARGDLAEALPWLEKFIALSPADPNGWLRQGEVLLRLFRFPEAADKLRQALTLAPEAAEARRLLGHALFNCNRFAESIDTLAPFMAGGQPIDIDSLRLLCRAAEEVEDYARAAGFAARLVEISPDCPEDLLMTARIRFAAGEENAGIETYRRYLTRQGQPGATRNIIAGRVVTTETWEIIAARWISLGLPSENIESGYIRPSLTRHDQATVLAPEWLVITRNNDLLVEQMTHNPKTLRKKTARIPSLNSERFMLDPPDETLNVVEACAMIGGSTNYYHWLIDYLPRIGILAKAPDLHGVHLLVNADLTKFQRESLAALGIGDERLIFLPPDTAAHCRVVWVPTLVSRLTSFHPFVAGWLRRSFLKKEMKQAPRRRLFVSRTNASQRRLLNETQLIEQLLPMGFEVIEPGSLSFTEQVAAFATADIVVGPHGAGLTNIVFAPQEVQVVELGFPQYPATFFSGMAGQLGQRFLRIDGQPISAQSTLPHTWDFHIDLETTRQKIASLIGKV